MIESVAEKLALRIKQTNEEETSSVAVMKFALIFVINIIIPLIIACIVAVVTGRWAETALSIGAFVTLRMLSGGYHFNNPALCMLVTTAVLSLPPYIIVHDDWVLILTAIGITLFAWLAPANMKGYNTMPAQYYPLLKVSSVLITAINFLILSPAVSLVVFIQGISLLLQNKEVNSP